MQGFVCCILLDKNGGTGVVRRKLFDGVLSADWVRVALRIDEGLI